MGRDVAGKREMKSFPPKTVSCVLLVMHMLSIISMSWVDCGDVFPMAMHKILVGSGVLLDLIVFGVLVCFGLG